MGVFFSCFSCSLVATRRRTTVESAEARNESWRMVWTRGVGLFRLLSSPTCKPCPVLERMLAHTSVALTYPSAEC